MSIRSLDFLDIPLIARYRNDALTLDSTRALTRGHPLGVAGLLTFINPARNVYGAIANSNETVLVGGVIHTRGETYAKLLYLAPSEHLDHNSLPDLVDHLVAQVGEWGAFHVIAELDESSQTFTALRQAGFSVYAWQRMWEISKLKVSNKSKNWTRARSVNRPALESLYNQIVPQIMQPIEPLPKNARGLICNDDEKCYVSLTTGAQGIVLTPLIHPDATNVEEKLTSLLNCIPDRRERPVYLSVRSYQAWLEPALADLGANSAPRQAVMVKHLARFIKDGQTLATVPSGVSVQPSRVSRIKLKDNE
ncbi:MAG: hypothetical protein QGM50_00820 [Anaerolineae bacterium]|nr:hypothetical protein [Anaerolineae bacterium]MDK1080225.1 hypothetical protein [Anaerolineae bacterium]MDK1117308.1 hypothetical protein [Anaerolineae bacterium]